MRKILEKIDLLHHKRNLTQGELESLSGLTKGRISKWKDDKGEPSAAQAWRLAKSLGVSVEWLLNDDANMEDWDKKEGLSSIEGLILYHAGIIGHDEAARLLIDEISRGGGKTAKKTPPDKPHSSRPTPALHEHDVTPNHDGRRRTRRRKPKGGGNSNSAG